MATAPAAATSALPWVRPIRYPADQGEAHRDPGVLDHQAAPLDLFGNQAVDPLVGHLVDVEAETPPGARRAGRLSSSS